MINAVTAASALLLVLSSTVAAQKPSYQQNNLPAQTENGQTGTNICTDNSQSSNCQTLIVNSLEDFCLWGPPTGPASVGDTEAIEVVWCTQAGHGARVMPAGTITGAHFVQTPHYVQITGVGNFGQININAEGGGGELDPHGATGNGNPIGGLVFSNIAGFGSENVQEWTNFMSDREFCIRICNPASDAYLYCQHIYDVMGCGWNMPGNYNAGSFDSCSGDANGYPGIDGGSTFHQGDAVTPPPHAPGATSNCRNIATITGGSAAPHTAPTSVSTSSSTSSSSSSSIIITSSSQMSDSSTSSTTSATTSSSSSSSTTSTTSKQNSTTSTRSTTTISSSSSIVTVAKITSAPVSSATLVPAATTTAIKSAATLGAARDLATMILLVGAAAFAGVFAWV